MANFLKGMAVVTIMALLYIHLQMNIYALAYQGKKKETKIEKLAEHNAMVQNDILRLQSSDHIGRALLSKEKTYQFASKSHVLEVESQGPVSVITAGMQQGQGFFGKVMTLAFSSHQ
jgi:cell division protein FtsL